jgi:hypothetical protein
MQSLPMCPENDVIMIGLRMAGTACVMKTPDLDVLLRQYSLPLHHTLKSTYEVCFQDQFPSQ